MPYKDYEKQKENSRNRYYRNKKDILEKVKKYYYKNWEKKQEYNAAWYRKNPDKGRAYRAKYAKTEKGRVALRKGGKSWASKAKNRIKIIAHGAVRKAVRNGTLFKPKKCSDCKIKTDKLQGHHYKGYKKENHLSVKWLCPACHKLNEY